MSGAKFIFLKSRNIWFGIPKKDIAEVRMNQRPSWYSKPDHNFAGISLVDEQVFNLIHLNGLFGHNLKPESPVHLLILKSDYGKLAIPCQQVRTRIDLPKGTTEDLKNWTEANNPEMFTHWFPFSVEEFIIQQTMTKS